MPALRYIQVILPLKLEWRPTYSIPDASEGGVAVGRRVRVVFARKEYVGVICAVDVVPDVDPGRIVPVESLETNLPDIMPQELQFWEFISSYYLCSVGEVYKAAYPVAKLRSEMVIARKVAKGKADIPAAGGVNRCVPEAGKPRLLCSPSRREEYLGIAGSTLDAGRSVLVVVPDNGFSDLLEKMLSDAFGNRLLVYNSRKTAVRRRKIADALREGAEPYVVLGSRMSLFLPFCNLGLVVVDEEQDPLHRQTEPAPRFNARDCAAMLAEIHGASLVLSSSTPSLETLLNCGSGKYVIASSPLVTPAELIDVSAERRKNGMAGPYSFKLKRIMESTEGRRVIVRGWEVQEELDGWTGEVFGKDCGLEIMTANAARRLPGKVPLIAVLQADAFFSRDDFRADERALQLFRQLSERTDRLVVQTAKPEHPVFRALSSGDGPDCLLKERKDFSLPPYTRIVDVCLDDPNEARRNLMTSRLCRKLQTPSLRLVFKRDRSLASSKEALYRAILEFEKENKYTGHIHLDVDPV